MTANANCLANTNCLRARTTIDEDATADDAARQMRRNLLHIERLSHCDGLIIIGIMEPSRMHRLQERKTPHQRQTIVASDR